MDDLLAHLKAINDPACAHLQMSYMDYMAEQYTYGSAKGLHNMPDAFATDVLGSYCQALINLFHGRPFAKAHTLELSRAAANDFKHVVRGLLALDDADWRPVALVVMVEAEKSRHKTVPVSFWHLYWGLELVWSHTLFVTSGFHLYVCSGGTKASCAFCCVFRAFCCFTFAKCAAQNKLLCWRRMCWKHWSTSCHVNLEHLAVLLALVNTKKGGQKATWRKKRYGQVMQLLQDQLTDPVKIVKQLQQATAKMWASLPAVQQLGSEGRETD